MNLSEQYYAKIRDKSINPDVAQEKAVELLNQVALKLEQGLQQVAIAPKKSRGFFSFFGGGDAASERPEITPDGVYLWGGVGRGKTWLMDMFFSSVVTEQKKRYHFHHFMEMLHKAIKQHPDQPDPLRVIAKEFASDTRLLCLDELHLTEITNARLLLPVLQYLLADGVLLVTTSNRHPTELYQGSLKKALFVPYTDYIAQHMQVLHLDSERDYRTLEVDAYGDNPQLNALTDEQLEARFTALSVGEVIENTVFTINHRPVSILRASDNIIWLDFAEACAGTRTTSDYIWMTDRYAYVMLSDVFVMTEDHEPVARRFFNMVDELYDRKVPLLFSAENTIDQLYQGYRLRFAFKRTLSRLTAMYFENKAGISDLHAAGGITASSVPEN